MLAVIETVFRTDVNRVPVFVAAGEVSAAHVLVSVWDVPV